MEQDRGMHIHVHVYSFLLTTPVARDLQCTFSSRFALARETHTKNNACSAGPVWCFFYGKVRVQFAFV